MSLILMTTVYSQEYSTQKNVVFDVEVRVVDKENSKPIKNADVSINGKLFRYNYINEYYPVKAMVGQQLVVVHPGFETVYYDNYTEIHLENSKKLVSKTLKYFEEALLPYDFARIHKSYLVNINSVVKYKKGKGGSVIVSSGKEILVSSSKKANLLSYFK